jgi:hypothetical protein
MNVIQLILLALVAAIAGMGSVLMKDRLTDH